MNFAELLLNWYDQNARKLPWRETADPYGIWVSEVMLQQTQVSTVIPYYRRFMAEFPTLAHLAKADLSEVMKVWEGLGYYRRVRLLHQGVREVMERFGGKVPCGLADLASLPGIGPYMVGSIASIAFNIPVAAVDGNVVRVVARILALGEDLTSAATRRKITQWVQERFPEGRAGAYTQALMELGALICTPKQPQCGKCPVWSLCSGVEVGPENFPIRVKKVKIPEERRVVLVITWEGRRLLVKRPEHGLMAGFWEYPHFTVDAADDALAVAQKWTLEQLGAVVSFEFLKKTTHVYSHLRWNLEIYQGEWLEGKPAVLPEGDWFEPQEEEKLNRVAFVRKLSE